MARTLNKVQLIGRLGADPEAHSTATGTQFTTFSLATNRQWTGPDGAANAETDWHRVVAWGNLGETCLSLLKKGRLVYIEGRLSSRSWEADGQKFQRTEVVAGDMLLLDAKPTDEAAPSPQRELVGSASGKSSQKRTRQQAESEEDLMELPF